MIKTSKRDALKLQGLINEIESGLNKLMGDDYAIMRRSKMSSSDVFTAPYYPNQRYSQISKQYGNDLVPMFSAIHALAKLIKPETLNQET